MRGVTKTTESRMGNLDKGNNTSRRHSDASLHRAEDLMAYAQLSQSFAQSYADPLDPSAFMRKF